MNSRNPSPQRVWGEAPRSGRWRRFRHSSAPPAVFHFAHFRCKKGVEIIFEVSQDDPKAARCLLLRQDRCLLLRQDRCLLLRQVFKSQIRRLGLNRRKWPEMGPE